MGDGPENKTVSTLWGGKLIYKYDSETQYSTTTQYNTI